MLEWVIAADDRTGALEVAGEAAPWLGPVTVSVGTPGDGGVAAVVDIGTRHVAPSAAGARAVAAAAPARHRAHKIDSLLRGNWAHELVALQGARGDRVLVVPALPRLGRTCRHGVVLVDGLPVGAPDARRPAASPRPAEHLVAAGAPDVVELADAAAVEAWAAAAGGTFAVCDASTDADLDAVAAAWLGSGLRFAGTAGSIAAAVAATRARAATDDRPALGGDVLVVCGSLHPTARAQLAALRSAGGRGVTILASPEPVTSGAAACADRVAAELGAAARTRLAAHPVGVLVVVGGDTAAAVLGDEPLVAGGTLAPGVPWSRRADGGGPLVVTKAGGFGHPTTLVDLLAGRSHTEAR